MKTEQKLALGGAALLALGAFVPLMSVPIIGSINYFMNGKGDGTIILALAAVIGLAALFERYTPVLVAACASLLLITYTFVTMQAKLAEMQTEMGDNPLAGLVQASIQMQWGWLVLVLGAGLSLYGWVVARRERAAAVTA